VSDVRELIERYAAAWGRNDRDGWLATFAPDATQEDPIGTAVRRGRDEIAGFWDDAMAGYHSVVIEPRDIFVTSHEAAMVWRITAEFDGGWRVFGGVDVFTVDDTPLITSVRAYWEVDDRRVVARDDVIHHLAIEANWDPTAVDYRQSTIERTLAEEGFIHCSFATQVAVTAAKFYAGRDDVVLLTIDPALVPSEIKVEGGFPHIYGPLPREAVIQARPLAV
jgi:uncharacterized protein (TIGR02246 family)